MDYTSRTVRCNEPGLTQEQALASLYTAYGDGIRIAGVKRRGEAWVVSFKQPKLSEFPPKADDKPEAPEQSDPAAPDDAPDDAGPPIDGPPSPDGDGDDDGGEKKDPQAEILHMLHEITMALGIGGGLDDKMPPEGEHPGDLPPGPDAGMDPAMGDGGPPMGGPPGPPMAKKPSKLKPGEVLPSQTPLGSPAFASTRTAGTITVASAVVDPRTFSASAAEADLKRQYPAYGVKQLKFDRTAGVFRALLSIH